MLSSKTPLTLKNIDTNIVFFTEKESQELAFLVGKRNLFERLATSPRFYVERVNSLANKTIIEVFRPQEPDDMIGDAERVASWVEKIAVLSSTLVIHRVKLHKLLAIYPSQHSGFNVTIGRNYYTLRSKTHPDVEPTGIIIDERFCRRFERSGFQELALMSIMGDEIPTRIKSAIDWLFESKQEPLLHAAVVKTSIALESLLIFSESESLSKSLSERSAFILSSDPDLRKDISHAIKKFYEIRSGIVHGSRKKVKMLTPELIEGIDRLTLFLCLVIASNIDKWQTIDHLNKWCEMQRWGHQTSDISIPISNYHLRKALNLCLKENS